MRSSRQNMDTIPPLSLLKRPNSAKMPKKKHFMTSRSVHYLFFGQPLDRELYPNIYLGGINGIIWLPELGYT